MAFADLLDVATRTVRDHLGGTVRYQPEVGDAVNVVGVFDAAYQHVNAGEAGVESASPAVFLRLADLPADPDDDEPTITVGGVDYRVRECQKDGQGGVVLLLHRTE